MTDWRSCGRCVEISARITTHHWRHGSVSPRWLEEAEAERKICEKAMMDTAAMIVRLLQERRTAYRAIQLKRSHDD